MSLLSLNSPSNVTYCVHPVVVFSILDHFKRRKEGQEQVVGTLLGYKRDGKIAITNCFAVPAKLNQHNMQITIDQPYHTKMLKMYSRINRDEVVVGWYCTGDEITYLSAQIHQKWSMQEIHDDIEDGVHLTVNVNSMLEKSKLEVKAYTAKIINVRDKEAVACFQQVKLEHTAYDSEKIGIDTLLNGEPTSDALDAPSTILSDVQNLSLTLEKLLQTLEEISSYVESVREGKVRPDPALGIELNEALGSVPMLHPKQFKHLLNQKLQSLLMISYLTNLTRTQVALSDKIASTLG